MTYLMKKKKSYSSVDDIFLSDKFGLFGDIKSAEKKSSGSLITSNFERINEFLDTHKRKPKDTGNLEERGLAVRLSAYRKNPTEDVIEIDRYGLLDGFITKSEAADQAISAIGELGDKKSDAQSPEGNESSEDFCPQDNQHNLNAETIAAIEEIASGKGLDIDMEVEADIDVDVDAASDNSDTDESFDELGEDESAELASNAPATQDSKAEVDDSTQTSTPEQDLDSNSGYMSTASEPVQQQNTFGYQQELGDFTSTDKDAENQQNANLSPLKQDSLPLEAKAPVEPRKGLFSDSSWAFPVDDNSSAKPQDNTNKAVEGLGKTPPDAFIRSTPDELGFFSTPTSNESPKNSGSSINKASHRKDSDKGDFATSESSEGLKKPASLDDLLNKVEGLGLLDDIRNDLFEIPDELAVLRTHNTSEDDVIGKRDVCLDFDRFADVFKFISKAMSENNYTRHDFVREKSIHIGSVFVIGGLTAYVADKYVAEDRDNKRSRNERVRLIFSNGTESNILAFSLSTVQYKDIGEFYQVEITDTDWIDLHFADGFAGEHANVEKLSDELSEQMNEGEVDGIIYVARLIDRPDTLYHYTDLHKIGMTKSNGDARTKKSVGDATFLHREVEIVSEWQIANANVYKVESFLHKFFHHANVNMSVVTRKNNVHGAREWFDVPLNEIEKAINLIVQGDIVKYTYNKHSKRIEPKKQ